MVFQWREYEPFHKRFCLTLYAREIRCLEVGDAYIPNSYDEPGVLLFTGRNRTHAIKRLIDETRQVANETGQPCCFYVTPSWEDPELAALELSAAGCRLEAEIGWYLKHTESTDRLELPEDLRGVEKPDTGVFREAYEEAFEGHPGWKVMLEPVGTDVSIHVLFLETLEGRLAGFGGVAWDDKLSVGIIFSVGVPKAFRGRGYGKAVSRRCLSWLAERGIRNVVVGIVSTNVISGRLHESLGFAKFAQAQWWELQAPAA